MEIGPFCTIGENVSIGAGTRLHSSVVLDGWTEIGENNEFYPGVVIGVPPQDLKYKGEMTFVRIGSGNIFREYVTVHRAAGEGETTSIGDNNLLMAYVHVAHNCNLGNKLIIANSVGLSGHVTIEDSAVIGGMVGSHQHVRIGKLVMVGGYTKLVKDVPPYALVDGYPARIYSVNLLGLARHGFSQELRTQLKEAMSFITSPNFNLSQALEKIKNELPPSPEMDHLVNFLEVKSKRGIMTKAWRKGERASSSAQDE
ncbi:MAG: acyl-ACP--UDP-N-acetylglucosamine O-acyltransferase [Chloroflexi bacterium]|nr:acyl-ACP--UDP-N-acetylglucosamine O-acyltransferase [Chloroflexota bacterium]